MIAGRTGDELSSNSDSSDSGNDEINAENNGSAQTSDSSESGGRPEHQQNEVFHLLLLLH